MAFLYWKDEYSVKVREFDDQHKNLFRLINEFVDASKKGAATEAVRTAVRGLAEYAIVHFKAEEDLMSRYNYGDFAIHKAAHENLTLSVLGFMQRLEAGTLPPSDVSKFLMDWLVKHILGTDRKYSEFFNGIGVS